MVLGLQVCSSARFSKALYLKYHCHKVGGRCYEKIDWNAIRILKIHPQRMSEPHQTLPGSYLQGSPVERPAWIAAGQTLAVRSSFRSLLAEAERWCQTCQGHGIFPRNQTIQSKTLCFQQPEEWSMVIVGSEVFMIFLVVVSGGLQNSVVFLSRFYSCLPVFLVICVEFECTVCF